MTQVLIDTIASGSLLALVSFGLALIYRTGRVLHMAHASTYLVGGYVGLVALNEVGGLPVVAAMIGMLAAASIGIAVEAGVYGILRQRGSPPEVLLLASIGVVAVVSGAIGLTAGSDLLLAKPSVDQGVATIGFARISTWRVVSTAVGAVVLGGCAVAIAASRFGVRVMAVASDPDLARSVGLRVGRVRNLAMGIGSGLAGLSAFLVGADTALSPQSGLRVLLLAFTAMIVGGTRTLWGPITGSLFVAFVQQMTSRYWNPAWQDGAVFAVLLAALLIRPSGIVGARS